MRTFIALLWLFLLTALSKHQKQTFTSWLRRVWIPGQNVKEILQQSTGRNKRKKFLRCPAELYGLVSEYFASSNGIPLDHELINKGIELGRAIDGNKGTILVQVIEKKIYYLLLNKTAGLEKFQEQRFDFFVEMLQSFLAECDHKRLCGRDFEFLLDLKDCHTGWTTGSNSTIVEHYAKIPIFAMTRCKGRSAVPVVQWYTARDGLFERWNEHRLTFLEHVEQVPQWSRRKMAVFRGAFRPYSSWNERTEAIPTLINETNWHLLGRSRLQYQGWQRPDLLNVGIQVAPEDRKIFEEYAHRLPRRMYLSMVEQAQQFQFAIHSEGWCGWADRLKLLFHSKSTIFLQSTPCLEYYQGLFKPWIHYIPVDGLFKKLEKRIGWARRHPKGAEQIANNSLQQAQLFLNEDAIRCYQYLVFAKYLSLLSGNFGCNNETQIWNKEF